MADAVSGASSASIGIQDFLKILVAQLNYQDPLEPMSNEEFVGQLAQFTSLEQTQQINSKMDSILQSQSTSQSIGLIGRTVDVLSGSTTLSGKVSGLSFASGSPVFSLLTSAGSTIDNLSLSQITAVR